MLVVFGKDAAEKLKERMTILELDTFMQQGLDEPVTAYAVIEMQDIPIQELAQLENMTILHNTMWVEYRRRNFNFCLNAMEHLYGKWNNVLDSFYDAFSKRINELQQCKLPESWSGVIYRDIDIENQFT